MTTSSSPHLRPAPDHRAAKRTGTEGTVFEGVPAGSANLDLSAAERAVADLLRALGLDPHSSQLELTPQRVVQNLHDLITPPALSLSTFENPGNYTEPVLLRDIPFVSVCEHHLLPFHGVAHVGYAPTGNIVGLSALAQIVEHFARSLQIQERLTTQIADYLEAHLSVRGAGVTIEAEHSCVTTRGVRAVGARAVTQAFRGELEHDANFRSLFAINTGADVTARKA